MQEEKIKSLMEDIKSGVVTVKWDGWFFSGGRDYGNWHTFRLIKDNVSIGIIEINDLNGITIDVYDEELVYESEDEQLVDSTTDILMEALKTGDPEFVEKNIGIDGIINLPTGYYDIDRADLGLDSVLFAREEIDPELAEMFPDWQSTPKGEWSDFGRIIQTADNKKVEIGLYREPKENLEYDGTLTLQIFVNDDVVVCEQVSKFV